MLSREMNAVLTEVEDQAPMGTMMSRFWLPALLSEEVASPGGSPVRVRLLGRNLVAFRDAGGRVGLLDARCPHRSVDLFFGRNEGDGLRCVYHGWKFDASGRCLDLPSEPDPRAMMKNTRATSYPVHERAGMLWAYLGPGAPPPLPELELFTLPAEGAYVSKRLMQCNYMQALEGSLDTSHLTFLHRSTAMTKDIFGVGELQHYSDKDGAPVFFCQDTDYGMAISARRRADEDNYYWRVTQWLMPVGVLVPTAADKVCRANFFVPIDDHHCWWYRVRYHPGRPLTLEELEEYENGSLDYSRRIPGTYLSEGNRNNDYGIDREAQRLESFTGIASAQLQDIAVQESQGPIVDRSLERLGTSDTAIVMCRRRLIREAQELKDETLPQAALAAPAYRVRAVAITLPKAQDHQAAVAAARLASIVAEA